MNGALKFEYFPVITPLTVERFFAEYGEAEERYELIDGIPYMMAAPSDAHQALSMFLSIEIGNFLKGKKCKIRAAPYDVFLNESPRNKKSGKIIKMKRVKGTVVQPDIVVICDKDKIKEDGCHGAPDLVIEIVSASTKDKDRSLKRYKYFESGVKEFWLVDPTEDAIIVYQFDFENKKTAFKSHAFDEKVKSHVLDGLEIDFSQVDFDYEEFYRY